MDSLTPQPAPDAGSLTAFDALLAAGPDALNAIPSAVYLCDGAGRLVCYNDEAARLWGRAPAVGDTTERFCGAHRLYLPDGTFLPHDQCPMATAVFQGVTTRNAEVLIERQDGTRVTALVNIHPLLDRQGKIQGAINCFHDISHRKQLEEEIAQRSAELDDFFSNSVVPMHIVDGAGILKRANQAELDLLGYEAGDYIGQPISAFHVDADVIEDILDRLARGQALENHPARLRAKDGSIRHVLISSSGRFSGDRFVGSRCCTIDITSQKRMEEHIRNSERQLRELLEALPAAVYTTDAQGRITFYNEAAAELAGRRPLLGVDQWCVSWKLYHPDGSPMRHEDCPMAICLKQGRAVRGEQAIIERPDGRRIPFTPYPTPLRDADGAVVGAINMLVDISAHKQAEERQKALIDELNHRVKNTLATVQSLLRRTARHARDVRELERNVEARILALARAHDLLSKRYWMGVELETLVREIVAPYADAEGKLTLAGAAVNLSPRAALSVTMALNELATNAAKYGALRAPAGSVSIDWRLLERDRALALDWIERDVPDVTQPPHRGFGTSLIERCIERDLGGKCTLRFETGGVRCSMTIPLTQLATHG